MDLLTHSQLSQTWVEADNILDCTMKRMVTSQETTFKPIRYNIVVYTEKQNIKSIRIIQRNNKKNSEKFMKSRENRIKNPT